MQTNFKSTGSGILFKTKFLERLTRTHIAVPVSLFLLYATALFYFSLIELDKGWLITLCLFAAGLLFFTWTEYQIHRRIFHLKSSDPKKQKLQYTIHGVHHEFPKDKERLAMPPVLSVTIATLLLVIARVILNEYAFGFLSGFFTGYAGYLLVHYVLHVFAPPANVFRILWVNHAIHHYRDSDKAFGVSSPLWDFIYRTLP